MTTRRASLRYPHEAHPGHEAVVEVARDILWARLPLPFRLNHVNVWIARDGNRLTLIDTGASTDEAEAIWSTLLDRALAGSRPERLIATHGHTDHVGLASWLVERAGGIPFHSTWGEWLSAHVRYVDSRAPMRPEVVRFLLGHGCDPATVEAFRFDRERTHAYLREMPASVVRLREGHTLRFGGRDWHIMLAGGHATEHASFYCEAERLLIAGDQILSKISPMIGVFPWEPEGDPLTDYLASLERFRELPEDTYVLPGHGLPFYGLHHRIDQLAAHHAVRLETLADLMDHPRDAMSLTHGLLPKAVAEGQGRNALAETLAHAHHLVTLGRARREVEGNGRVLFGAVG